MQSVSHIWDIRFTLLLDEQIKQMRFSQGSWHNILIPRNCEEFFKKCLSLEHHTSYKEDALMSSCKYSFKTVAVSGKYGIDEYKISLSFCLSNRILFLMEHDHIWSMHFHRNVCPHLSTLLRQASVGSTTRWLHLICDTVIMKLHTSIQPLIRVKKKKNIILYRLWKHKSSSFNKGWTLLRIFFIVGMCGRFVLSHSFF